MKFAIIAAGEGSRLAAEGVSVPKPLVRIGSETLIDRLIRIFLNHRAEEVVVACRDTQGVVASHLNSKWNSNPYERYAPLRIIETRTPSSMHSLYELSPYIGDAPFILTTVDTVFSEKEFSRYVRSFTLTGYDGLMGVTAYVDDESPLYVQTDKCLMINGFHDRLTAPCRYISAGVYGLKPSAIPVLRDCVERGEMRMRNFQRALLSHHLKLRAYPLGKVVDIDHSEDIEKARHLLDFDT